MVIGCGVLTPLLVEGSFATETGDHGYLVLLRIGPVIYKIQRHAEADPEIIHVDKLMPYQADFGEELRSWLQDTETTGHRVIGTQICDPVPPTAEA